MILYLYDTMTRKKRPFVPRDPGRVTMYVCGPTVYGYAHIGNARPVVVFDVLFRVLRHIYGEGAVMYARNVTDVDDKINAKAQARRVSISAISERYLAAYHRDMDRLGALRPTLEPRATLHVEDMKSQIAVLLKRKAAYLRDGHVLFDTQAFPDYGKLSGRPINDMIAGARVEVAPYKRHPADFVLWKPSKPGDPQWDSPWGGGRPGWHIECSAMIESQLGLPIDIHGGGIDLIFPHHENELAQAACAHGGEFVGLWMHNGFLDMSGEKMSKSIGNVVVPHELLKVVPGEVLRWALLSAHYRAPLNWSDDLIERSWNALDRLYGLLRRHDVTRNGKVSNSFIEALYDDLNTPNAFSQIFELASQIEKADAATALELTGDLRACAGLLGFLTEDPEKWFQTKMSGLGKRQVWSLIQRRALARERRQWGESDLLKEFLTKHWVRVEDAASGTRWSIARDRRRFEELVGRWLTRHFDNVGSPSDGFTDFYAEKNGTTEWVEVKTSVIAARNSLKGLPDLLTLHGNAAQPITYSFAVPTLGFRKSAANEIIRFFEKSRIDGRVLVFDGLGELDDMYVASPERLGLY